MSPILDEITLYYESLTSDHDPVVRYGLHLDCTPTPGNRQTTLRSDLPWDSFVDLRIYDLAGKQRATIVTGVQLSGPHQFDSPSLDAGVYVCRLEACGSVITKRVVVLK